MNLFDLVSQDVHLTIRNREAWGCCPFHDEKTPSFSVNIEKQLYHCFGCGASGDAIEYLRNKRGMSFQDAKRTLGIENRQSPVRAHINKAQLVRTRVAFWDWENRYYHAMENAYGILTDLEYQIGALMRNPAPEPHQWVDLQTEYCHWQAEHALRMAQWEQIEETPNEKKVQRWLAEYDLKLTRLCPRPEDKG